jgi:hypothetical protein
MAQKPPAAPPPPPPTVGGIKIDAAKATPMPQGIKDLLVFRGPSAPTWPVVGRPGVGPPPPVKGLSSADKLALIRRAGGPSTRGTMVERYLMLTRAMMRTGGRGEVWIFQPWYIGDSVNVIAGHSDIAAGEPLRGEVILVVHPEAAGQLYLAEFQMAQEPWEPVGETVCRARGNGGRTEETFRLRGLEVNIIPLAFESASTDPHGYSVYCGRTWHFISVEVSVLR